MTVASPSYTDVSVRGVTLRYGRTTALHDVSFAFGAGVTGLLGPNGAGKTTLLRVLATAITPDTGTVSVFGADPSAPAGRLAARRRLGYMPQEPGFHPNFTTFEFVDYVAILKELGDRRTRHDQVRHALAEVGLSDERSRRIKALSGGMRRRVALAAAIVGHPDLLILDEPTVGLDPEQRLRFRELIAELGERCTVLLSTHQTEDVMSLCRRVVVLHTGRVRFEGPPAELADVARGRVWLSQARGVDTVAAWRTGEGEYRNLGSPPPGARLIPPTLEDGYLLLGGADAQQEAHA
ncbi:ABC transporter ATP-binding protein [Micromonospora sp. BQ11]|uniref:ABC transporter ATP-binding protein n=1 Tax=Micromonospora sp. BQ11 TaxID=3452212 RepID=UPI003F8C5829